MMQIVEAKCPGCKKCAAPFQRTGSTSRCAASSAGSSSRTTGKSRPLRRRPLWRSASPPCRKPSPRPCQRPSRWTERRRRANGRASPAATSSSWPLSASGCWASPPWCSPFTPPRSSRATLPPRNALASNAVFDLGSRSLEQYRPPEPIIPELMPPDPPKPPARVRRRPSRSRNPSRNRNRGPTRIRSLRRQPRRRSRNRLHFRQAGASRAASWRSTPSTVCTPTRSAPAFRIRVAVPAIMNEIAQGHAHLDPGGTPSRRCCVSAAGGMAPSPPASR